MANAHERAQALIGRLNNGQQVAGTGAAAAKIIGGIARGGRTGNAATDAFVRALSSPQKPATQRRVTGPLMQRAQPKAQKDSEGGAPETEKFLDGIVNGSNKPNKNTLKGTERSLTDGITVDGFEGPAQPSL